MISIPLGKEHVRTCGIEVNETAKKFRRNVASNNYFTYPQLANKLKVKFSFVGTINNFSTKIR